MVTVLTPEEPVRVAPRARWGSDSPRSLEAAARSPGDAVLQRGPFRVPARVPALCPHALHSRDGLSPPGLAGTLGHSRRRPLCPPGPTRPPAAPHALCGASGAAHTSQCLSSDGPLVSPAARAQGPLPTAQLGPAGWHPLARSKAPR